MSHLRKFKDSSSTLGSFQDKARRDLEAKRAQKERIEKYEKWDARHAIDRKRKLPPRN